MISWQDTRHYQWLQQQGFDQAQLQQLIGNSNKWYKPIALPVHWYQDTEASARGVVFYRHESTIDGPLDMHKQVYQPKDALMSSYSRLLHNFSFFQDIMETLTNDVSG